MEGRIVVDNQFQQHRLLGIRICQEMRQAIAKMGFSESEISRFPVYEQAEFSLAKDPYTSEENLIGYWYDEQKQRIGNIQFLSDGSFYADYDIVKPHPTKKQWFVEGVSAWGKDGHIKSEAKLLLAPL